MNIQLPIWVLVFALPVLSSASQWNNETYLCSKGTSFERKVELEYFSTTNPVPCESRFYRDVEGFKIPHLLIRAEREVGKCEEKYSAYLDKMKRWGVDCKLVKTPEHLATASSQASTETLSPVPPDANHL